MTKPFAEHKFYHESQFRTSKAKSFFNFGLIRQWCLPGMFRGLSGNDGAYE